jgi:hypothetical protein
MILPKAAFDRFAQELRCAKSWDANRYQAVHDPIPALSQSRPMRPINWYVLKPSLANAKKFSMLAKEISGGVASAAGHKVN